MTQPSAEISQRAKNIKLAIFDVDGVLTDGRLWYTDEGREAKSFHSRDGLGLKALHKADITVAIITGRTSTIVSHRAKELGIIHVYQDQQNKAETFAELLRVLDLKAEQAAMMGDDVIDLPVMRRCGLGAAPVDAHPRVLQEALFVSEKPGGRGAAREFCELLLSAQGHLDKLNGYYA